MAPKRSAQPPPPVESSDETASGSGSEEEEIAHSPSAAAPKSAPPPQKGQEPEASDEDEGEDEEDEDEEEEDDDEEEEGEKANNVIPSSATKNPPPQPPTREESETSGDEEEEAEGEADDEMPQTKPAPDQEMEAKGAKRPGAPFQRVWSTDDEFRILEALAAHRLEHGTLPQTEVLANALAGKLDKSDYSVPELQKKVKSLQTKYSKKFAPPNKDPDRRLFDLSKDVWPSVAKAATKVVANNGVGRELDEMCEQYPYLAEEVKAVQNAHPGLFKREFAMIDDDKARLLNEKIKKQRRTQMNLHLRRHDLTKEVTKTLMDLIE